MSNLTSNFSQIVNNRHTAKLARIDYLVTEGCAQEVQTEVTEAANELFTVAERGRAFLNDAYAQREESDKKLAELISNL